VGTRNRKGTTMIRSEKGQVLVLLALCLFVLLGFAALGIDVGYMYSVRHELQRCADAGALAGASAFTTGDWNNTSMAIDAPRGIADFRARDFASKDEVIQTALDPNSEVTVLFPEMDRIEVITSRNTSLFFGPILGMPSRVITARAVAEARMVGSEIPVNCIKPWAIPYPWHDDPLYGVDHQGNPNGTYDTGETIYDTCVNGVGLCPGSEITVKIGTPNDNTSPSGQQSSGQFFIIQGNLGGDNWFTGGSDYRYYIANGCFDVDMTLPIDLMTGDKVGPTRQGVADLIAGDPDATWDPFAKRPVNGDYDNNWTASPRVVRIVIYNPSVSMLGSTDGHGTHTYIPEGYDLAGFWLQDMGAQGTVTGRYIPAEAFGAPDETPGPPTGTELKVIALVE
jgi:Putative Flp pilus-assembly TadE/G-like